MTRFPFPRAQATSVYSESRAFLTQSKIQGHPETVGTFVVNSWMGTHTHRDDRQTDSEMKRR